MIKKIFEVVYKYFRGTARFAAMVLIKTFCLVVVKIWGEEGVTKKKIKRVRFLTEVKLMYLRLFPHLAEFLGHKEYLEELKERIGDGL